MSIRCLELREGSLNKRHARRDVRLKPAGQVVHGLGERATTWFGLGGGWIRVCSRI